MIEEGEIAPDFELPTMDGKQLKLSQHQGRPVVIYFYPKDDTSGCTTEAKDFTSLMDQFRDAKAEVFGISPDSVLSHQKFAKKHDLAVGLASDGDKAVAAAYGVWVEKSMYGRKYMGVERATFIIDKTGKIAKVWNKVKVPGHAAEVLAAVQALKS